MGSDSTHFDRRSAGAYVKSDPSFSGLIWRAPIAAQLSEKDRAVELLRDLRAKGAPFERYLHRDMYLEPLQGSPPMEELLKPKG